MMHVRYYTIPAILTVALTWSSQILLGQITRVFLTEEDRVMQKWEQRAARILMTDKLGEHYQGRIIFVNEQGFAWQDGHQIYQPGDPVKWIQPHEWGDLQVSRRGFGWRRGWLAGLAMAQMTTTLAFTEYRSGFADGDAAISLGFPAGIIGSAIVGAGIGYLTSRVMRQQGHISPEDADVDNLRHLAAYRYEVRVDTVDGMLVPRRVPLALLEEKGPWLGISCSHEHLSANANLGAFDVAWPSSNTVPYLEPLYFYHTAVQRLSLFFMPHPGTRLGIGTSSQWDDIVRLGGIYDVESVDGFRSINHRFLRGRQWRLFAEQQVLPWRLRGTQPWRLSIGGGGFMQHLTSRKNIFPIRYYPEGAGGPSRDLVLTGSTSQTDEGDIQGVELSIRLSYRPSRYIELFSIYRRQWTTTWAPPGITVTAEGNVGVISATPQEVTLSGTSLGLGATLFLW